LLRCINLLEPIDDGEILVDGVDISAPGFDANLARRDIGMVFQSYNLFPHMSVLRNITLALKHVAKSDAASSKQAAMDLLSRFGLADKADSYPEQLSGGQQQRVAIIRAVALKPKVLLLDEVTAALDPELVGEVLDLIAELRTTGMTMVLATHEMSFARNIADTVCFLHAGDILEKGSPAEVLDNPHNERTQQFLARTRRS
jgi:polar amino acid transport system ATP-binding protein